MTKPNNMVIKKIDIDELQKTLDDIFCDERGTNAPHKFAREAGVSGEIGILRQAVWKLSAKTPETEGPIVPASRSEMETIEINACSLEKVYLHGSGKLSHADRENITKSILIMKSLIGVAQRHGI